MSTVLVYERHPVHPDHSQLCAQTLEEMTAAMRSFPGALWADAARAFDDDPSFVVLSEWRTSADAEAWLAGPDRTGFEDRLAPWAREAATVRRFSP